MNRLEALMGDYTKKTERSASFAAQKEKYTPTVNGKRMARNLYAHTEEECEAKLAEMIKEMKIEIEKLKQGG